MKVYYNGVTLSRVMTKKWEEVVRYDETGVNALGSTIRMAFEASVLADDNQEDSPSQWVGVVPAYIATAGHGIDSGATGTSFTASGDKLKKILRDLQIPRCPFRVYDDVSGTPIFEAYPESVADYESATSDMKLTIDVNNGPKPISVSVSSIIGEYYQILFEIEVTKIRCYGGESSANDKATVDPSKGIVISNRCWTEETLDNNFYITRVFSGKLTTSSNNVSAHAYRDLFYPPLEIGFRRESVRFSESQDGLSLNYVVTDRQVRNSAPYPITQFSGSVQYSIINMVQETCVLQLSVVGSPFSPRKVLLGIARLAMCNKINSIKRSLNGRGRNGGSTFNVVVTKFDISENIGDPPSFTLTAQLSLYVNAQAVEESKNSNSGQQNTPQAVVYDDDNFNGSGVEATLSAAKQFAADSIAGIEISESFKSKNGDALVVADDYNQWIYNRKLSSVPNPYGYNIYNVYDKDDDAIKNESRRNSFCFIKSIASVPCVMPGLMLDQSSNTSQSDGDSNGLATFPNGDEHTSGITTGDLSTSVEEQDSMRIAPAPDDSFSDTGITEGAFSYPYTLYKSHAVYSANYHRRVRPQYFTATEVANFAPPTVVDYAPPEGRYYVTIEAERLNRLPELPDPEEILTVANQGESQGGIEVESTSSVSETTTTQSDNVSASSNTTIDNYCSGTRTSEPMKFYCLNNTVQIAEPKPTLNGNGTMYTVLATYEYATSRPLRKGDEVRLLLNPLVNQSKCYYPRAVSKGNAAITAAYNSNSQSLYNGSALNHMPPTNS